MSDPLSKLPPGFAVNVKPPGGAPRAPRTPAADPEAPAADPLAKLPPGFTVNAPASARAPDDEPPATFMEKAGEFISDTAGTVKKAVVGENEFPELPEFLSMFPDEVTQTSAVQTGRAVPTEIGQKLSMVQIARSPVAKMTLIEKHFPGTSFSQDKFGNIIVNLPPDLAKAAGGQTRAVINKSGLSKGDFDDFLVDLGFEAPLVAPAMKVAGMVGKGALTGLAARGAGASVGTGLGSLARDAVSQTGLDFDNAKIAAMFGAAGSVTGELLFKAFSGIARRMKGNRISADDRKVIAGLGIDPDDVSPDFVRQFREGVDATNSPRAAALDAAAESLPGPKPPLTQGQLLDDPGLLTRESQIKDMGTQLGANPLLDQSRQAQSALKANVEAIQKQLGRSNISSDIDAADAIVNRVRKVHDAERAHKNALYRTAKDEGRRAFVPSESFDGIVSAVRRDLVSEAIEEPGRAGPLISRLELMAGKKRGFNVTSANVNALENVRKAAQKILRTATDPSERIAAGIVIKRYDEFVRGLIDNSTDDALAVWKKASRNNRAFAERFQSDDVVEAIVAKRPGHKGGDFKVGPDEAVDLLFGRGKLGGQKNMARNFRKLKTVLGPKSPEWQALREAAWLRLFKTQKADALVPDSGELFSAAKFSTELTELLKKPAAVKELFSAEEIQLMKQFRAVAMAAEREPNQIIAGRANRSGTGADIFAQKLANYFNRGGTASRFIGHAMQAAIRKLQPTFDSAFANQATSPLRRAPSASIATEAPAATATATTAENFPDQANKLMELLPNARF